MTPVLWLAEVLLGLSCSSALRRFFRITPDPAPAGCAGFHLLLICTTPVGGSTPPTGTWGTALRLPLSIVPGGASCDPFNGAPEKKAHTAASMILFLPYLCRTLTDSMAFCHISYFGADRPKWSRSRWTASSAFSHLESGEPPHYVYILRSTDKAPLVVNPKSSGCVIMSTPTLPRHVKTSEWHDIRVTALYSLSAKVDDLAPRPGCA
jgi:hypothetical protein